MINARNMENIKLKCAYLIWPYMQIQKVSSIFAYRAQQIRSFFLKKGTELVREMWCSI
jgi:hypothetical protein